MESTNEKRWVVAEIKLVYKSTVKPSERPKIGGSQDAHEILRNHWDDSVLDLVEQFKILLLNRANKVLGVVDIASGGIDNTIADPRLIFAAAVKAAASGIILAHNHPSGNLKPSDSDIAFTAKLKAGGKLLELQMLDHLILTRENYYSFADNEHM